MSLLTHAALGIHTREDDERYTEPVRIADCALEKHVRWEVCAVTEDGDDCKAEPEGPGVAEFTVKCRIRRQPWSKLIVEELEDSEEARHLTALVPAELSSVSVSAYLEWVMISRRNRPHMRFLNTQHLVPLKVRVKLVTAEQETPYPAPVPSWEVQRVANVRAIIQGLDIASSDMHESMKQLLSQTLDLLLECVGDAGKGVAPKLKTPVEGNEATYLQTLTRLPRPETLISEMLWSRVVCVLQHASHCWKNWKTIREAKSVAPRVTKDRDRTVEGGDGGQKRKTTQRPVLFGAVIPGAAEAAAALPGKSRFKSAAKYSKTSKGTHAKQGVRRASTYDNEDYGEQEDIYAHDGDAYNE